MHRHDDADHVRHRQQLDDEVAEPLDLDAAGLLRGLRRGEVLELVAEEHDLADARRLDEQEHGGEEVGARPRALLGRDLVKVVLHSPRLASAERREELLIWRPERAALQRAVRVVAPLGQRHRVVGAGDGAEPIVEPLVEGRVVVVEPEVGPVLDGAEEQAVEVLRGRGVEGREERADRVLLGVALLHADLAERRLAEVLVEVARQVLEQHRFAVSAGVGVEDRRLRPQGAEALAVVDGAEHELADGLVELLGLDLGAEEATVLTVVVSAEHGDGFGREGVVLEAPLVVGSRGRRAEAGDMAISSLRWWAWGRRS